MMRPVQREQEEAAKLYDDFVESFKGEEPGTKAFVRGGTINPNAKLSDGKDHGKA